MTANQSHGSASPEPVLKQRAGHEHDHTAATRDMFDRLAGRYDLLNTLMSAGVDRRWRNTAVAALVSHRLPPGPVLDLCAGTLDISALIEAELPSRSVIASDLSPKMLERGLDRKITRRTTTVVADATSLPLDDHSVAGAICSFGIRNVSDPAAAMRELRRVIKPSGPVVFLEFYRPEKTWPKLFHTLYAKTMIPTMGRAFAGDSQSYEYLAKSMAGFMSVPEFENELVRAGFIRVRSETLFGGVASVIMGEVPRW